MGEYSYAEAPCGFRIIYETIIGVPLYVKTPGVYPLEVYLLWGGLQYMEVLWGSPHFTEMSSGHPSLHEYFMREPQSGILTE